MILENFDFALKPKQQRSLPANQFHGLITRIQHERSLRDLVEGDTPRLRFLFNLDPDLRPMTRGIFLFLVLEKIEVRFQFKRICLIVEKTSQSHDETVMIKSEFRAKVRGRAQMSWWGGVMYDLGLILASLFGGVFGAAIGFFLFVVIALLLALPYIFLNRSDSTSGGASGSSRQ